MLRSWILALMTGLAAAPSARAVIVYGDADGQTTAPADDRGWRYVGRFAAGSGVAIGPHHFLSTRHQGGTIGGGFAFNGATYTTTGFTDIADDLRLWQVDQALPHFADRYAGAAPFGAAVSLVGYGVHTLGEPVTTGVGDHGWEWGSTSGKSWGMNVLGPAETLPDGLNIRIVDFDALPGEATLAEHDSGGGLFVEDGGVWKLVGILFAVESSYARDTSGGGGFTGAIYDGGGLWVRNSSGDWVAAPDRPQWAFVVDVPSYADAIDAAIPEPATITLTALLAPLFLRRW